MKELQSVLAGYGWRSIAARLLPSINISTELCSCTAFQLPPWLTRQTVARTQMLLALPSVLVPPIRFRLRANARAPLASRLTD